MPAYRQEACELGYSVLSLSRHEYLRGLTLQAIGRDKEMYVLADTLLASCEQTGWLVREVTGLPLADVTTYNDLWLATLLGRGASPKPCKKVGQRSKP